MGVTIPVGFGQFTLPISLAGDTDLMAITFGFTDDPGAGVDAIATTIDNTVRAQPIFAASSISSVYTLKPGEVTINRALGTFQGVSSNTDRIGTAALGTLPQNCAVLVTKLTTRGGRRGRGRMYMPTWMLAESNVTAVGDIGTTAQSSIQLEWNNIRSALIPLNLPMVLLHSAPAVGPPVPPDAVTALTCSRIIATQRRRLRR